MSVILRLFWLTAFIVAGISAWILKVRMRRHIKRATGMDAQSESELTSLTTWIKVKEAEEREKGGKLH